MFASNFLSRAVQVTDPHIMDLKNCVSNDSEPWYSVQSNQPMLAHSMPNHKFPRLPTYAW
jgi:hypothetical protein